MTELTLGNEIVRVKNVSVSFKRRKGMWRQEKFWAIRDLSFEICKGETLGVLGRNGVGKSTLLKLIAGILKPDCGTVERSGITASMLSLQVGFVPNLTGKENAILSGMLLGLSKKEVKTRMPQIEEYADIGEFIDQPVSTYSAGMRARLGFAIAVFADPDIILLDEVLGVGDQDFRKKSSTTMREKIQSNKTVVLVSHHMQLLKEVCTRVIWIESGQIKAMGDPAEIIKMYQSN